MNRTTGASRCYVRKSWLAAFPVATITVFIAPIALGLVATTLPAFGFLPALGYKSFSFQSWRDLWGAPGIATSLVLTVFVGLSGTLLSFVISNSICSAWQDTRWFSDLRKSLAPLLAVPHAAFAVGLAFVVAPSGWVVRILSPTLTGWNEPPDIAIVHDQFGLLLIFALICKEVPFLLLMTISAIGQTDASQALIVARSLGYGRTKAWYIAVFPQIYHQIRFPIFATLAYSLSVVDMTLVVGPTLRPPLSVLLVRWFSDPDFTLKLQASAGGLVQISLVIAAIGLWRAAELPLAVIGRRRSFIGERGRTTNGLVIAASIVAVAIGLTYVLASAILALWSVTESWPFPAALPSAWSSNNWNRLASDMGMPVANTLVIAITSVLVATILVIGCLHYEQRASIRTGFGTQLLIFIPLLVPQIGFLLGVQIALISLRVDGSLFAVVWAHILYVLPYIYLALGGPWRSLDWRYERIGTGLGLSHLATFWCIRMPMMLRPVLTAISVGFAVSVAQYLPTLLAGAGRIETLTTETVALASGADRRVTAAYAMLQGALPLLAFALAVFLPHLIYRHRRGMWV